jgi:hypothetical protein
MHYIEGNMKYRNINCVHMDILYYNNNGWKRHTIQELFNHYLSQK